MSRNNHYSGVMVEQGEVRKRFKVEGPKGYYAK